jgi:hypothetical protein
VDIVALLSEQQARLLAAKLGADWYADPDQMRAAIASQRAFNLIHIPSMQKFDVFPVYRQFDESQLHRATDVLLTFAGEDIRCPVASAEDILLAKLDWYRAGAESSERQWSDIMGLLETNPHLDLVYVRNWAHRLQVEDLLARALSQR